MAALLTCSAITDAANQCGIGEVTLHRWRKDAAFQSAYRDARRAVVQHAITQVQRATGEAVEILHTVVQDTKASASARVSAAKAMREATVKGIELEDLAARIATLDA